MSKVTQTTPFSDFTPWSSTHALPSCRNPAWSEIWFWHREAAPNRRRSAFQLAEPATRTSVMTGAIFLESRYPARRHQLGPNILASPWDVKRKGVPSTVSTVPSCHCFATRRRVMPSTISCLRHRTPTAHLATSTAAPSPHSATSRKSPLPPALSCLPTARSCPGSAEGARGVCMACLCKRLPTPLVVPHSGRPSVVPRPDPCRSRRQQRSHDLQVEESSRYGLHVDRKGCVWGRALCMPAKGGVWWGVRAGANVG
jgi:hypothetical protein